MSPQTNTININNKENGRVAKRAVDDTETPTRALKARNKESKVKLFSFECCFKGPYYLTMIACSTANDMFPRFTESESAKEG